MGALAAIACQGNEGAHNKKKFISAIEGGHGVFFYVFFNLCFETGGAAVYIHHCPLRAVEALTMENRAKPLSERSSMYFLLAITLVYHLDSPLQSIHRNPNYPFQSTFIRSKKQS